MKKRIFLKYFILFPGLFLFFDSKKLFQKIKNKNFKKKKFSKIWILGSNDINRN